MWTWDTYRELNAMSKGWRNTVALFLSGFLSYLVAIITVLAGLGIGIPSQGYLGL
jgi:hypothetical protein